MKKVLTFALAIIWLVLASSTSGVIKCAGAASSDYSIEKVDHTIQILYNGYVSLNDTIQIEGTVSDGFLIGLPYDYGPQILKCVAYSTTEFFPVTLNVPLENRIGFYGVKINFGQQTPQVFNVVFLLAPYNMSHYSGNLLVQDPQNASLYTLGFPAYPSLVTNVANCSVSILLPEGSKYIGGSVDGFTYYRENLRAFTSVHANFTFFSTEEHIRIMDFEELKREIEIGGAGGIKVSDTYHLKNKASREISSIEIFSLRNASEPNAHSLIGRKLRVDATEEESRFKVTFGSPLEVEESTVLTMTYSLPEEGYIERKEHKSFDLTFLLFQDLNYYIHSFSVTFILPEGAELLNFENASTLGFYSLSRNTFQEALTIDRRSVTPLDNFETRITYRYDPLWLSFRPTLWMWVLATVGCLIVAVWRRPAAPIPVAVPKVAVRIRSKDVKSFVDAYERKRKIILEIESLRARVSKGKIQRRRYKVRRRTLETRLNALSRNLTDLTGKLQAAGGTYRDLMRRLEVAETEINEVKANIESIEARHRRGELSLGAYRRLRADYEQRKDKAQATVNEILMRLREKTY